MEHTKTRQLLAALESEIAVIAGSASMAAGGVDCSRLRAAYSDLYLHMALGPEPETRACPQCGRLGMRMATVCRYCWTKTTPPDSRT